MKKTTLFLFIICFFALANLTAQTEFITTWKTDNTGISSSSSITIPTNTYTPPPFENPYFRTDNIKESTSTASTNTSTTYTYSYNVDWENDGTIDDYNVTGDITHDYGTAGTYTVAITGNFPQIYFNNSGDKEKILSIEQWGTQQWASMENSFFGCSNMVDNSSDYLTTDTSLVTNMSFAFAGTTNFNQNLGEWDISNVTNMSNMFLNAGLSTANYDKTLIGWNTLNTAAGEIQIPTGITFNAGNSKYCNGEVSKTSLTSAPYNWTITDGGQECLPFITTWKTDNTGVSSDTSIMITINPDYFYNYNYYSYNVDWENDGIIDDTNVTENITHDYGTPGTYTVAITGNFPGLLFLSNVGFDHTKLVSVEQWGTNQWLTMQRSFSGCKNIVFNASDTPDLSLVTDMSYMFQNALNFNSPLNNWNVSNVTNMEGMFYNAEAFNQPVDNWDVSNVANMSAMFSSTDEFNSDISNWNVSNVTDMGSMFNNAKKFNGDISIWNMSNVTNMYTLFFNASAFNQNISNWNTSNVTNMQYMFASASSFDQNLGDWDISKVTNMDLMFINSGLSTANYDNTLIGWNTLDAGETKIPTGITFSGGNSTFCNGEAARTSLTSSTYNWTITDGDKDSGCTTLSAQDFNTETISLYPNPVKSSFTIKGLDTNVSSLQIVNLQGLLVKEVANYKAQAIAIAIDTLANGMYFVNITTPNGIQTIKIIKE